MKHPFFLFLLAALLLPAPAQGGTLYVSSATGNTIGDGRTPQTAMNDLQRAIDAAADDDVILVAEGVYLGAHGRGYIENGRHGDPARNPGKFVSIYGGYSADFTSRDVLRHASRLQPTTQQFSAPLMNVNARRPDGYLGPAGRVVIDGLVFDLGENNRYYMSNIKNAVTGTPGDGVLTGRFIDPDEQPQHPYEGVSSDDDCALYLNVEGDVRIANCLFVNCRSYGICGLMGGGHMEICNNVFVACRCSACQVRGDTDEKGIGGVSLAFHHNTVMFSWTRTKEFADMGQGFRFMNGIGITSVHDNIFGCNSGCALERVSREADPVVEAGKVNDVYGNYFFANHCDLAVSGGRALSAARIGDADSLGPRRDDNVEMPGDYEAFVSALDLGYLQAFLSLPFMASKSYGDGTLAEKAYRAFGPGSDGSVSVLPTMYCNKYPWRSAMLLFGKVLGRGAQLPIPK